MLSFYGKVPTTGDFLTVEIPRPLLRPLEDWLSASLAKSRDMIDGDWQATFDAAPTWNFWIGNGVLEQGMAGVWKPSRDRVGRRFPACLFASSTDADALPDAPVLDAETTLYDGLSEELVYLESLTPDAISERLKSSASTGLGQPDLPAGPSQYFWAMAPEAGSAGWQAMTSDIAQADLRIATADRSYWWTTTKEDAPTTFFATKGLPAPETFAWFLTGLGDAGFTNDAEGG